LQRKYLGEPYGFFVTHIGHLSRVVHLWQYEEQPSQDISADLLDGEARTKAAARFKGMNDLTVSAFVEVRQPAGKGRKRNGGFGVRTGEKQTFAYENCLRQPST
jgi:hypothetical protein